MFPATASTTTLAAEKCNQHLAKLKKHSILPIPRPHQDDSDGCILVETVSTLVSELSSHSEANCRGRPSKFTVVSDLVFVSLLDSIDLVPSTPPPSQTGSFCSSFGRADQTVLRLFSFVLGRSLFSSGCWFVTV
jgi:hypothetical protein